MYEIISSNFIFTNVPIKKKISLVPQKLFSFSFGPLLTFHYLVSLNTTMAVYVDADMD